MAALTSCLEQVWLCVKNARFLPAFLISQKSKIFDCFPPGKPLRRIAALSARWADNYAVQQSDKRQFPDFSGILRPGKLKAAVLIRPVKQERIADPKAATQVCAQAFLHPASHLPLYGSAKCLSGCALHLYFQTEDTYQVTENSEGHAMHLVLCTPEDLCFAYPLEYLFDVNLQSSDLWLFDISSLCRDYESLICGAWPAGHYRLLYCIDGQVAGEFHFSLD